MDHCKPRLKLYTNDDFKPSYDEGVDGIIERAPTAEELLAGGAKARHLHAVPDLVEDQIPEQLL